MKVLKGVKALGCDGITALRRDGVEARRYKG
jgi:hypothetical protein